MLQNSSRSEGNLEFFGGVFGVLAPFFLFLGGVAFLGLSGAPDERGFWPVLVGALLLGMILAKDRRSYSDQMLRGMSQPLVLLMIMAWLLAGALAMVLSESGLIGVLLWAAQESGVSGAGFVGAAFLIGAAVSTTTGTSLGTLLLCGPLLYPTGVSLEADPAFLIGAILGGATFGDNISPLSDTTIASASTQGAELGAVVRTRLKYALPAAAISVCGFSLLGGADLPDPDVAGLVVEEKGIEGLGFGEESGDPRGWPMLLVPVGVIVLLLQKRSLLEALLFGLGGALLLGLGAGLLEPNQVLSVDRENFIARSIVLDGMERAVGVSVFTILLMGLVAGIEGSGLLARLVEASGGTAATPRRTELWIFGAVSGAVLLTTHSVVALLTVGRFVRERGERGGIGACRRANLLDLAVCTYPFLLPFFIPTVLASSTTVGSEGSVLPRVSPWDAGFHNLHSWALFAILLISILTGWGRGVLTRS